MSRFRAWPVDQPLLLPPSVSESVKPGHLCLLVRDLARRVLLLCREAGIAKLGHVALDGTKVRANASKHKSMSYKRMKELEPKPAAARA